MLQPFSKLLHLINRGMNRIAGHMSGGRAYGVGLHLSYKAPAMVPCALLKPTAKWANH